MNNLLHKNQNAIGLGVTPFALLSVLPTYTIDWLVVDHNLSILQETLHPDCYPLGSHERELADVTLSLINNAYSVLKDPIQRIRALFDVRNIPIPGKNGQTINDPLMMDEAFLLKESLDEACIKGQIDLFIKSLNEQQKLLEDHFNNAFLNNDEIKMKKTYIRLSFCLKTLNDAKAFCFENKGK
ncbi:MAG: hypothetical protein V4482_01300 [Pseudomonadota bacterium]